MEGDTIDKLRASVVQSAQAARLMGVDFVPMYHTGVLGVAVLEEQSAAPLQPAPPRIAAAAPPTPPPTRRDPPPAAPTPAARQPSPRPAPSAKPASKPVAPQPNLIAMPTPAVTPWPASVPGDVAASRNAAARQTAMDALRARYEADAPHKHFKTDHHTIVWGEGDIEAELMFIGEAPGEEEDQCGRPFVGRSGQLLEKMIVGMGLKRSDVYIANVLKTRPPNNATPTSTEASLCAPYLIEQIAIIGPGAIVTLGLPATRLLLQSDASMSSLRGRWSSLALPDGRVIPVMPTYHPAYVLRSYTEEVRGKVWSDLQMAMEKLGLAKTKAP